MAVKNPNPKMIDIIQVNHFGLIEEKYLCKVCGKSWKPELSNECPNKCKPKK